MIVVSVVAGGYIDISQYDKIHSRIFQRCHWKGNECREVSHFKLNELALGCLLNSQFAPIVNHRKELLCDRADHKKSNPAHSIIVTSFLSNSRCWHSIYFFFNFRGIKVFSILSFSPNKLPLKSLTLLSSTKGGTLKIEQTIQWIEVVNNVPPADRERRARERRNATECQHFSNNYSREFMSRLIVAKQRAVSSSRTTRRAQNDCLKQQNWYFISVYLLTDVQWGHNNCATAHSHKVHCSFFASTPFSDSSKVPSVRVANIEWLQLITSEMSLAYQTSTEKVSSA